MLRLVVLAIRLAVEKSGYWRLPPQPACQCSAISGGAWWNLWRFAERRMAVQSEGCSEERRGDLRDDRIAVCLRHPSASDVQ